jgi:hypothetical protein
MSESEKQLKPEHIKLVEPAAESIFDNIDDLRRVATLKVSRRVVPVNVAVKRPANNVFFRCHADPQMSLNASIIIGDGGSDDFYFVAPAMLDHATMLPRLRKVTIATVYSWPGGAISLWPIPNSEETRIACWKSARAAYELSKTQWVQLVWNNELRDYDVIVAEGINTKPAWPTDKPPEEWFRSLLRLGFEGKIITGPDHPYVQRLRGITD